MLLIVQYNYWYESQVLALNMAHFISHWMIDSWHPQWKASELMYFYNIMCNSFLFCALSVEKNVCMWHCVFVKNHMSDFDGFCTHITLCWYQNSNICLFWVSFWLLLPAFFSSLVLVVNMLWLHVSAHSALQISGGAGWCRSVHLVITIIWLLP